MTDTNGKLMSITDELQMKHECPQWSDIVNQAVDSKLESVSVGINMVEKSIEETRKRLLKSRTKKKGEIMLFCTVSQNLHQEVTKKSKHDSDYFLEICSVALDLDISRDDVKKIYKIGKRCIEARPLLVQLSSGMLKNHIMETTFKLRKTEKFENIVISHDMTKQERDQCKKLVAEAKEQEANDDSGECIHTTDHCPKD